MAVSYKPLWHQMVELGMKKLEFRDYVDISSSTLAKLGKDDYVSLEVIEKICLKLNCKIEDVVQIIPDEK